MFELSESVDLTVQVSPVNPFPLDATSNPIAATSLPVNSSHTGSMMPVPSVDLDTLTANSQPLDFPGPESWSLANLSTAFYAGNSGAISQSPSAMTPSDPLLGLANTQPLAGALSTTLDSLTAIGGIFHQVGSLWADHFTVDLSQAYNIISGNGNVLFGHGYVDFVDLSAISTAAVNVWNPATAIGGGVLYDPGNGLRVFDELVLANGSRILMEGIDRITFAEGHAELNSGFLPNDPLFSEQWNLHMMGVHNAWRFTQGSDNVLIGVQDSGLAVDIYGSYHPDIDPSRTYYASGNTQDDFGDGRASHGTAVHSIIGAASNNGIGMSGINWVSDIFNLDVLGGDMSDYELYQATQLMTNHVAMTGQRLVINMSLGGGFPSPWFEQLIALNQDNALFVIASGNEDLGRLSYPAYLSNTYSNVMAVGASWGAWDANGNWTNPGDRISYPGQWGSNYGYGLTLMGPSEVIAAEAAPAWGGITYDYWHNAISGDAPFDGTSAAAPNVAGVASLVWSANPYLSASQVNGILQETAYDLGAWGYDYEYGAGMVNADSAVRRAIAIAASMSSQSSGAMRPPLLMRAAPTI